MIYYFQFAPHVEWEHQNILYDVHTFLEPPFRVSVPQVTSVVKEFLRHFNTVGIIEPNSEPPSENGNHENTTSSLHLVTDYAYLIQVKQLNKHVLNTFCGQLVNYIQTGVFDLSQIKEHRKMLETPWMTYFAGLSEIAELSSFLSRFTTSRKKMYRQGYIFVMEG